MYYDYDEESYYDYDYDEANEEVLDMALDMSDRYGVSVSDAYAFASDALEGSLKDPRKRELREDGRVIAARRYPNYDDYKKLESHAAQRAATVRYVKANHDPDNYPKTSRYKPHSLNYNAAHGAYKNITAHDMVNRRYPVDPKITEKRNKAYQERLAKMDPFTRSVAHAMNPAPRYDTPEDSAKRMDAKSIRQASLRRTAAHNGVPQSVIRAYRDRQK